VQSGVGDRSTAAAHARGCLLEDNVRALIACAPLREFQMPKMSDRERMLNVLPQDGEFVTNKEVRETLKLTDDRYGNYQVDVARLVI
jgi:hypothetical protein